uniref:Two pore segment channel 2 n=1 Tax=Salmo trutta TaxID=8032 RepID=A0A674F786_SALTR
MESFPLLPGGVHSGSNNYRAPKETPFYWGTQGHDEELSIGLYRWYYSRLCQWDLNVVIFVILALAFIERPSSLSVTSGLCSKHTLWEPPCGLTEGIEIICLLIFTFHLIVKRFLIRHEEFLKCKWLVGYMVVISVSVTDRTLTLNMACDDNQKTSSKTLKCIKRTIPEITSLILLVVLHLCNPEKNMEWEFYFKNLSRSLTSLLVLLTTANNPDAYTLNRVFSVFFILFSGLGTYILMNLLTAIIYNQFRGYLVVSNWLVVDCTSQIECIMVQTVLKVMRRVQMKGYYRDAIMKVRWFPPYLKQHTVIHSHPTLSEYSSKFLCKVQYMFSQHYVTVVGNAVALANVVCISIIMNRSPLTFGWTGYVSYGSNVFDGSLTVLSLVGPFLHQLICQSAVQKPSLKPQTASNAGLMYLYYRLSHNSKTLVDITTLYIIFHTDWKLFYISVLPKGLQISIFATYSLPFSYW